MIHLDSILARVLVFAGSALAVVLGLLLVSGAVPWMFLVWFLIWLFLTPTILFVVWNWCKRVPWLTESTRLRAFITVLASIVAILAARRLEVLILLAVPTLLAAAVIRIDYRRKQRWQRIRSRCCEACGYDLRASQYRCPECGLTIPDYYDWYRQHPEIAGMLPDVGSDEDPPEPPLVSG